MNKSRPWRTRWSRAHTLSCLALLFGASSAFARDATCQVSLGAAQIDYGRLSRATLPAGAGGTLALPPRKLALHVQCPEPLDMTLSLQGIASGASEFRLADGGRFTVRLRDAVLDGERVDVGEVERQGAPPTRTAATLPWHPGRTLAPVRNGRPLPGRDLTAWMAIDAVIDERAMRVGDASPWTASLSVESLATGAASDLTIRAEAIPGRCNVEVTRHLSFGRLRSTELDARGASTRVPAMENARLQVVCDAPKPFAFRVMHDERAGTVHAPFGSHTSYADAHLFGLGLTPSGERIGSYVLHWDATATSDRGDLRATRSTDGGASWTSTGGPLLAEHSGGERIAYTTGPDPLAGPIAVTRLQVGLDATIYLAPRDRLSLNDEIRADGLMTFEIIY